MTLKNYNVMVEATAWVSVEAYTEDEAEEKAKQILEENPYAWDSIDTTITDEEGVEE